jgi:hypothetical protein
MFQRKMFHPFLAFFKWQWRNLPETMIRPVSAGAEGQSGLLKALYDSMRATTAFISGKTFWDRWMAVSNSTTLFVNKMRAF